MVSWTGAKAPAWALVPRRWPYQMTTTAGQPKRNRHQKTGDNSGKKAKCQSLLNATMEIEPLFILRRSSYTIHMKQRHIKSKIGELTEVVPFSSVKEKYNYKALLRGYEEVFDSKLRKDFEAAHETEVMFGTVLSQAMEFFAQVNQEHGWSNATGLDLVKMEKMCQRLDRMLKEYAPFFVRQKILDVGTRILNQEYLGKPSEDEAKRDLPLPASLKEFKARRAEIR